MPNDSPKPFEALLQQAVSEVCYLRASAPLDYIASVLRSGRTDENLDLQQYVKQHELQAKIERAFDEAGIDASKPSPPDAAEKLARALSSGTEVRLREAEQRIRDLEAQVAALSGSSASTGETPKAGVLRKTPPSTPTPIDPTELAEIAEATVRGAMAGAVVASTATGAGSS